MLVLRAQLAGGVGHLLYDGALARDFGALLDHVHAGDELVIEHDAHPVAVLRPAAPALSLDKTFAAIAQEVPDEEWERVPSDLAKTSTITFTSTEPPGED